MPNSFQEIGAGAAAYAPRRDFGVEEQPWAASRARPHLIVGGATPIGSLRAMSPINPITMLVWSAVFNALSPSR